MREATLFFQALYSVCLLFSNASLWIERLYLSNKLIHLWYIYKWAPPYNKAPEQWVPPLYQNSRLMALYFKISVNTTFCKLPMHPVSLLDVQCSREKVVEIQCKWPPLELYPRTKSSGYDSEVKVEICLLFITIYPVCLLESKLEEEGWNCYNVSFLLLMMHTKFYQNPTKKHRLQ